MEDKNRELNPEELAQGAGGVDIQYEMENWRLEETRKGVRDWKRRGGTKEQFEEYYGNKSYYASTALRIWDDV